MNVFSFIGNVTRDLQLRYLPDGRATVTYVVAVDRVRIVDEKRVNDPDFFPVTTYGRQAENDAKFLKRGSPVGVTCRVHSWFNQEDRRRGFNFEAYQVDYLGSASGGQQPTPAAQEGATDGLAEEWLREYDQAEQGAQRSAMSA